MDPRAREIKLFQARDVMLLLLVILASIVIIVGVMDIFQVVMSVQVHSTTDSIEMDTGAVPQFEMAALRVIDSHRNGAVTPSMPEGQDLEQLRDNPVVGIERLARRLW